MQRVTTKNATVPAQPGDRWYSLASQDLRNPARVSAPYAPETRVARVTPICTAEKNRFGSWASRAARWPRRPRLDSALTWPSRSETRAISEPAKNPPMRMMMRTTMTSRTTLVIYSLPLASGGAFRCRHACVAAPRRRALVAPSSLLSPGGTAPPLARGRPRPFGSRQPTAPTALRLASLDGIAYVSRGHAIYLDHLEIQHPAGGRPGDRL